MRKTPAMNQLFAISRSNISGESLHAGGIFVTVFCADFHLGEFGLEKASKNGVKNG